MPLTPEQQALRDAAQKYHDRPTDENYRLFKSKAQPDLIIELFSDLAQCNEDYGQAVDSVAQLQEEVFAVRAQLEAQEAPAISAHTGSEVTGYQSPDTPAHAVARKYGASAGPDFGDRPWDRLIAAAPFPIFDMTKHPPVRYDNKATSTAVAKHMSGPLAPMCEPLDHSAFEIWWAEKIARNGGVLVGADYRHWALKGYLAALSQPVQAVPEAQLWGISEVSTPEYEADQVARNVRARALLDGITGTAPKEPPQ